MSCLHEIQIISYDFNYFNSVFPSIPLIATKSNKYIILRKKTLVMRALP